MGLLGKLTNKSLGKKLIKSDPVAKKVLSKSPGAKMTGLVKKSTPTSPKTVVAASMSNPRQQLLNSARRRSVIK